MVTVSESWLISLQILANSEEDIVTTEEYSVSGTASYSLSNYRRFRLNSEYFSLLLSSKMRVM